MPDPPHDPDRTRGKRLGPITLLVDRSMSLRAWPRLDAALRRSRGLRILLWAPLTLCTWVAWMGYAVALLGVPAMIWSLLATILSAVRAPVWAHLAAFTAVYAFFGLWFVLVGLSVIRGLRSRRIELSDILTAIILPMGVVLLAMLQQSG